LEECYNPRCVPPWSVKELEHKVGDAAKADNQEGFLLNAPRDRLGEAGASPNGNGHAAPAEGLPAVVIPAAPTPQAKQPPSTIEIGDLLAKVFPEPKWAVDGLIPEGGALLAAR